MARLANIAAILSVVLVLAACETSQRVVDVAPAPQAPRGVEGRWTATGGPVAYTANFTGGRFTSVETATNGLLAEGTYSIPGPGRVSILYTSTKRRLQLAADCNQAGNQMSCASSNGSTFSLARIL